MFFRNSYTINGTVDYSVTAARPGVSGSIVLNNVKNGDSITISPLAVGNYTVTEELSNYTPTYSGTNDELNQDIVFDGGNFPLTGNSTVTVTNTR